MGKETEQRPTFMLLDEERKKKRENGGALVVNKVQTQQIHCSPTTPFDAKRSFTFPSPVPRKHHIARNRIISDENERNVIRKRSKPSVRQKDERMGGETRERETEEGCDECYVGEGGTTRTEKKGKP